MFKRSLVVIAIVVACVLAAISGGKACKLGGRWMLEQIKAASDV